MEIQFCNQEEHINMTPFHSWEDDVHYRIKIGSSKF